MAGTENTGSAGSSDENSVVVPKKGKPRGKPFEKGNPHVFKAASEAFDERINRDGRPKGTTLKEMLRRDLNRIILGTNGQPNELGLVRGEYICSQVSSKAMAGDMRAAEIAFRFDQDQPNRIGQGELVPGTVIVNANAQANAQVIGAKKEEGPSLVERIRNIYGLGPKRSGSAGSGTDRASAQG